MARRDVKSMDEWNGKRRWHGCHRRGCGGAVYGLGFIGALIYYVSTASGFWMGVLGVLKALVWPAILVYNLTKFFGA